VPVAAAPVSRRASPEQAFRHLRKRLAHAAFATIEELADALASEVQRWWDHPKVVTRRTNYPWWREGVKTITPSLS
jgi:hypothetical protein